MIQGIPWAYTWRELKDMFAEVGGVERADVATDYSGRSRVRGVTRLLVVRLKAAPWLRELMGPRRLAVDLMELTAAACTTADRKPFFAC